MVEIEKKNDLLWNFFPSRTVPKKDALKTSKYLFDSNHNIFISKFTHFSKARMHLTKVFSKKVQILKS